MKNHTIEIQHPVDVVDDGLLLGNGDISCSFYQQPGRLIWRFGKGDVWDRRVDYEIDPKPAHIDEMTRGIRDERWCCGPYGGPVEARNGTDNPERMKEICQGVPPSNAKRGYPTPKPVGEFALHYPIGMNDFRIRQTLHIETAELEVECSWAGGVKLALTAWMAPETNALTVDYRLTGYGMDQRMGENYVAAIYATLSRHADRAPEPYGLEYDLRGKPIFPAFLHLGGTPMEPPAVEALGEKQWYIEQCLPADPTYPSGFRCGLAARGDGCGAEPFAASRHLAAIAYRPEDTLQSRGRFVVAVASSPERSVLQQELKQALACDPEQERQANRQAAREFWRRSAISIPGEPLVEELWYANLHARRIAYKRGKLPPGLAFPSTVGDYNLWHGDFHMNYNFQQPFYGDYAANQIEVGDSYFDAMKPVLQLGRLIAERYYNSAGTFIQLSGYPIEAQDDILGCAPMGRMVYATGWAGHQYFWRYQYTQDREFLRNEGYPVLKSLAQFYLDFLKLEDDGFYHAFPSNQGEDGFTGNPEAYRDLPQILLHIRFALAAAEYAAKELNADPEFQAACRDRIDRLAEVKRCACVPRPAVDNWDEVAAEIDRQSRERRPWAEILGPRGDFFPPEFLGFDGNIRSYGDPNPPAYADPEFYTRLWYAGKLPSVWLIELRNACYRAGRDWKYIRRMLEKWRTPNGLLRAMALPMYGFMGAYTETTGILAPLQETLLEGHDTVIRVFPHVPASWGDASFSQLRAAGGFLVSARRENGVTVEVTIQATAADGGTVQLANPFGRAAVTSSLPQAKLKDGTWSVRLRRNQKWTLKREQ